jgi:nickel-dependent lactate racemase
MALLRVVLEYGDGKLAVDVPDSAVVVGPRKAVPPFNEPPDAGATIRDALNHPLGSERIRDLVSKGGKVLVAFPDRVKGGRFHRRLAIPLILDELNSGGISPSDITLLCTNGLHRMNTTEEMTDYLGNETISSFWPKRLMCHDAEDDERMVHVGTSALGDPVDTERLVLESDLVVLLGHALPNHYGGFSGGYKGLVTGTGSWRSIAAHHSPTTIMNPDLLPVSPHSTMRKQFNAQGEMIERSAKGKIFCLDAALNINGEIVDEFAGGIKSVQEASWPLARKIHTVTLHSRFDIVVVGLPRDFHYGPGMGTNPILMLNALGGLTARLYPCIKESTVLIAVSICDGWFNDEYFPSYREVYERYGECSKPSDLVKYENQIATNPEYVSKYRFKNAYHPFHAFSMMYYGEIALHHTSQIFIVGAKEPSFAKAMGFTPIKEFPTALNEARKAVGTNPEILALPSYFLQPPPLFEFKG